MDHYFYDNNMSTKLNIICFASINSKIKLKNDPIPKLFEELDEIKAISEFKNLTKILYFNYKKIHQIVDPINL